MHPRRRYCPVVGGCLPKHPHQYACEVCPVAVGCLCSADASCFVRLYSINRLVVFSKGRYV